MKLSTILSTLTNGIKSDADFRAFCLSRFDCRINDDRLTELFEIPEDMDTEIFLEPVHMYISISADDFDAEQDNNQCSGYTTIFDILIRFDTTVSASDIYDFITQFKIAIRGIDTAGNVPNYRGINSEFVLIENSFPAVRCSILADGGMVSDINDKETT